MEEGCGGTLSNILNLCKLLSKLPIWVAHGDSDTIVPIGESKRIVDSLKTHNTNIIFKVYQGAGHEVCTTAYEDLELFEWLLRQRKKK